jgi:hypothetical protein
MNLGWSVVLATWGNVIQKNVVNMIFTSVLKSQEYPDAHPD